MVTLPRFLRRKPANPEARMSVLDHLRELRRRLIVVVLLIAAGAVLGWVLYDPVLRFLESPYCSVPAKYRYHGSDPKGCDLIYTGVLDGFTTRLKVSFIAGTVFTAPLWLYQIWAFITPGLRKNERKYTVIFIVSSTLLFIVGMGLAYIVLRQTLHTLIVSGGSGTQALLTVDKYLSFITMMMLVFGLAMELPLIIVLANLAGALPARLLKKSQRLGVFLIFVFAAVATPSTDPFTMVGMAVPMVVLFEASVLFAVVHDRRKTRRRAAEQAAEHLDDDVASTVDAIPQPIRVGEDSWTETT